MTTNSLSGTVHGSVVQAGTVHGGVHVHVGTHRGHVVPRQLPPPAPHFVDRVEDLGRLRAVRARAAASGTPTLVAVSGPPGVGKTAAAVRWLRECAGDFPDGQVYIDLHGHSPRTAQPAGEVLARLLRAVGVGAAPLDIEEASALWRSVTAQQCIALLLDNARDTDQVRPLLVAGARTLTVVTSRRQLPGLVLDGAALHCLKPLEEEAGRDFLFRRLDGRCAEGDVRAWVTATGGLPLALHVVAARLLARPDTPPAGLTTALTQNPLAPLIQEEHPVTDALDQSYATLGPADAAVYRLAGLLPPQILLDASVCAAMAQVAVEEAAGSLERLCDASLLEAQEGDRYRMHDLVRSHAARTADQEMSDTAAAVRRAFDWHLGHVAAAERLLCPARPPQRRDHIWPEHLPAPDFADASAALDWLDVHRTGLMALVREASRREWHEATWQLVDGLWPLFHRLHHIDLWIEAHRIGLAAARAADDAAAVRRMLTSGAAGYNAGGEHRQAEHWYAQARDRAAEAGDPRDEGQALLGMGAAAVEDGRPLDGIAPLNSAVRVWAGIGYDRGVALARVLLGEIALAQNELPRARKLFLAALATFGQVNDPFDQARALCFVALTHIRAGGHDLAAGMELLEKPLGFFREEGALYWYGRALEMKGHGAQLAGDTAQARAYGQQALEAWRGLKLKDIDRVRIWLAGLPQTP